MNPPATPLLALALDSAPGDPAGSAAPVDPAAWLELLLTAERHGVSLVTLADTHRGADGVPRLDALMLAAYLLASQVATADFVSAGRAGWLVEVSGGPQDAAYVGPREAAVGEAAWAEAAEFVEVVRALWDSWEDGAEIRDIAAHRFIDAGRIHHIDFVGEHLSVKGPSITPRPPQGQPPVAIAVGDAPARELALAGADIAFLPAGADPRALGAEAAERGRELVRLCDVALDTASSDAPGDALGAGFDGLRLITTGLPEPAALAEALVALVALGARADADADADAVGTPGSGGPGALGTPGTLRDRLGLPRPVNRYAGATR
jgi:alkanesulfonate monooxygenase SsuD/methylene tetrahydromethanopterin reductase-like flavin-dependent oxidoreductase (luciferase family)